MANHESEVGLPPDEIIARIRKALKKGGDAYSWEDVSAGLVAGRFQLFWNAHGVCITEIVQAPRKRYLHAFVVAGELPGVMDLHGDVERHAVASGCAYMTTNGRMGWQSVLPKYGWKKHSVTFLYDLNGATHGQG